MTRNNKSYPQIDYSIREHQESVKIRVEAWVRLKRKGSYYLVFYLTEYETTKTSYKEVLNYFTKIQESTLDACRRLEHLWILPEKHVVKEMIEKGILKKCSNHQTNKEQFLTNLLIP